MNITNLKEKQKKLESVKESLKEHYVGIDDIIDEVIDNIKILQ